MYVQAWGEDADQEGHAERSKADRGRCQPAEWMEPARTVVADSADDGCWFARFPDPIDAVGSYDKGCDEEEENDQWRFRSWCAVVDCGRVFGGSRVREVARSPVNLPDLPRFCAIRGLCFTDWVMKPWLRRIR